MTQDIILSAKGIVNRFGRQIVHDGIDLEVRRGEILGLVGGSGTGKSVLLKTMAGLRKPNAGKVRIMGKPVGTLTPIESASLLAMLFQEGALFSSLTVAENIMLPLKEYTSLSPKTQAMLAQLKLALVGLPPESGIKYPAELSGGMRTRAALARALAMDPLVLFLDEPTSGLDPLLAAGFDELIVHLNKSLNLTVVMATHDLDSLFAICSRVAVLVDHTLVTGSLSSLLKNNHPWIKEFFHGPRARGAKIAAEQLYGDH